MKKIGIFFVFLFLISSFSSAFAEKNKLLVIPTENSIVLRWAPIKGVFLSELKIEVLRRVKGESWKKIATIRPDVKLLKTKYSFLMEYLETKKNSKDLLDLVVLSKFITDPDLAKAVGVFYEDLAVSPKKEYFYKLVAYAKNKGLREYVSPSWISLKDFTPYPPIKFSLIQHKDKITIKWSPSKRYVVYYVYRNGKCLNPEGTLVLSNNLKEGKMFFVDEGPFEVNTKYVYYLVGLTLSGKKILSKKKTIVFKDLIPPAPPSTLKTKEVKEGKVVLFWSPVKDKDLDYYIVWRSKNLKSDYKKLAKTKKNLFVDKVPSGIYYYRISGVDKSGNAGPMSQALMVLVPDQTPPSPVRNLKAEVSPGVVKLSWEAPPEKDLYGYKVYRRVGEGKKFVLITSNAMKSTSFEDTLDKRLDFSYIYYQVRALDRANNYSKPAVIKVKLPDVTPPSMPLVIDYSFNKEGVLLLKLKYEKKDVKSLEVLCDGKILKVLKVSGEEEIPIKLDISGEKVLQFIAIDAAGNKSKPFELRVFFPFKNRENELVLKRKKDYCELVYNLSYDSFFYIFNYEGRKISPAYYGNGTLKLKCNQNWKVRVFNSKGEVVKELTL